MPHLAKTAYLRPDKEKPLVRCLYYIHKAVEEAAADRFTQLVIQGKSLNELAEMSEIAVRITDDATGQDPLA
jgi:hypothetical protein